MEFKELFNIAREQLTDLFEVDDPDFRLEQAEFNQKEKMWEVVVSFLAKKSPKSPLEALGQILPFERIYKKVKINDKKEVTGFFIYDK